MSDFPTVQDAEIENGSATSSATSQTLATWTEEFFTPHQILHMKYEQEIIRLTEAARVAQAAHEKYSSRYRNAALALGVLVMLQALWLVLERLP